MNPSVFSAHFFPSIRYMSTFIQADNPFIDGHENMQKQSYRNRCYILSPNGKLRLNIPLAKNNASRQVKDIKICYAEEWQKEHFKSLEAAYRRSPFFEYYEYMFQDIYNRQYTFLFDLNISIMERLLKILQIDSSLQTTDSYKTDWDYDYRETFNPKKPIKDLPNYHQVFEEKIPFISDLSIIDLICNLGPESKIYLNKVK